MTITQLKEQVKTILREKTMNEENYTIGSVEYTKKNMTPTQILDLAMAYSQVQGKGTTIYGGKMEKMIKVANDLAKLNGTTQLDVKKRGDKPALILTLLKNKLVTKDEYITLYKDLLLKQTSVVKSLKNADPASRMVGGAAARAAHRDMKGEFGESVNEEDTLNQVKKGNSIILKRGNKIYATISQNPNKEYNWTVYFQKGPALSGYKTKEDAIARAQKMSDSLKSVFNKIKGESVVTESTEPEVISQLRDIVKNKQNSLVVDTKSKKKVRVDMQSANLMLQVYDALKQQSNKDKFVNGGIVQMGHVSYKLLNK
jgi:hypothetical protein